MLARPELKWAKLGELCALRDGLDAHRATDIVVVLFGHDVYRSLVGEAGWSVPEYKSWLLTTPGPSTALQRPKLTRIAYPDPSLTEP